MRTHCILGLAFVLGACLPAFAPAIRAQQHHRDLSPASADPTCMACHPSADELHGHMKGQLRHGGPPVVPTWMIYDERGCVGCHDVREPRR
jgi:hypothetical protein